MRVDDRLSLIVLESVRLVWTTEAAWLTECVWSSEATTHTHTHTCWLAGTDGAVTVACAHAQRGLKLLNNDVIDASSAYLRHQGHRPRRWTYLHHCAAGKCHLYFST